MSFRVLVVDDSPSMRSFIKRVMSASGLEVEQCFEAGDGQEALAVLDREWIDVVLSDINMPRMNGEEFVRRMAESGLTATVPVIIVSTDATALRQEHMRSLGARGYLTKPFLPEMLRDEIEKVLGVQGAETVEKS